MDLSTLNAAYIQKLMVYELPSTYHLGGYGSGCALDAPGFPSYFVRPIHTQHGNTPGRKGSPNYILQLDGKNYVIRTNDGSDESYAKRLLKAWNPLPLDHPRVRLWIRRLYQHMAHCYQDVERPEYGRPGTLIYPLPYYRLAKPSIIKVDPSKPEFEKLQEAVVAEMDRVKALNEAEQIRASRLATPENHNAVRCIRKFYPDYDFMQDLDLITNPRTGSIPDWWETDATCPTPEGCAPRNSLAGYNRTSWKHNTEPGHTCQWCGHTNPQAAKEA